MSEQDLQRLTRHNIKDIVRHYLIANPQARNYRYQLYADILADRIWNNEDDPMRVMFADLGALKLYLYNHFKKIPFETARREMQHIQNDEKMLRPDNQVSGIREERQEFFRKKYGKTPNKEDDR